MKTEQGVIEFGQTDKEFITEKLTSAAGCIAGAGMLVGFALDESLKGGELHRVLAGVAGCIEDLQGRIEGLASGGAPDNTGETLADFVNRNRPAAAPAVSGEAAFIPEQGLVWSCGSWRVTALMHGICRIEVIWEDLERADQDVIGYALEVDGRRTHIIENPAENGNGIQLDGWPEEKAA